ncbi:MAG: T9SS type A sorting domain-containing protein [Bacteroidota bacterium]|nr:T9SS type A sorting domain-containing protein [Bacteroidota bacterium]
MKRFILFVLMAVVMTGMVVNVAAAQTKVTFIVNTATISDTVNSVTSKLAIQGDFPAPNSWSDVAMTNIGGDYWSATMTLPAGGKIAGGFKFRANGGWEGDFDTQNNRQLTVGSNDTILPIQYYYTGGFAVKPLQYWKPFVPTGVDSFSVWVRVNMKNVKDSAKFGWKAADVDSVTIMGDNRGASGDFSWGPLSTKYLKREGTTDFYSGRIRFAKAAVVPGDIVEHKFRLGWNWGRDELQNGAPNRKFTIPVSESDTTLPYVFFNNDKPYYPGPVKVTFIVNTATVADTITGLTSKVTVTGGVTELTNWGAGVNLTNIGGDYWSGTITMLPQAIGGFKYRVNGGWEDNFNFDVGHGNDRTAVIGTKDTTLPVVFYNATGSAKAEYWRPWPATSVDSLNVWVRVNMKAVVDNGTFGWKPADKDSVTIMGDNRGASGDFSWGPLTTNYLKREGTSDFYSGRIRFAKSKVVPGDVVEHKFRLGWNWGRDELQGKPNRSFKITVGETDTTLAWKWFDDAPPVLRVNADTAYVTFRVNMKNAIDKKGFSQNDTIVVQSGFFKTGAVDGKEKQLKLLLGSLYSVTDTIVTSIGKVLNYQFYLVKNNIRVREYYFNFDYTGTNTSEQERRQVNVATKSYTINDTVLSTDKARRQPLFPSQVPLKQAVTVKWVVDLRSAYAQVKKGSTLKDGQGTTDILSNNIDSIKVWGVGINGPATNLPTVYPVGDWATWSAPFMTADTAKRRMWDDGAKGGDVKANDTLYTVTYTYPAGSAAGKISKYGIKGGDNETGFGLNHLDNIDDANATFTINVAWGSINPKFYNAWDFDKGQLATGVAGAVVIPTEFALQQNFPNPFNPSTTIKFALPIQSNVRLTVFNVIGQEVATLVNENMAAGNQSITFNASHLSSGVYFYRLVAGQFTSIKKMMLVK